MSEIKKRCYPLNKMRYESKARESKVKNNDSKVDFVYRIPKSGDYIKSWKFHYPPKSGLNKKIKLIFNDIDVSDLTCISVHKDRQIYENTLIYDRYYALDINKLRQLINNIDCPETPKENKLINIERIFEDQHIESVKMCFKKKELNLPRLSKEILKSTLWMGDVCVEIYLGKNSPDQIVVEEEYYEFLSPFLKKEYEEKRNEEKKGYDQKGDDRKEDN